MLIPYSATQGYSMLLSRLSDTALIELDRLMRSVANERPSVQREALMELLPTLGAQYEDASSMVSAEFFAELQVMQEVRKPVAPTVIPSIGADSWRSLIGFGSTDRVLERGGMALMYSMIAGGMVKRLTEASADTMVENGALQGGMRSQRVPQAGCCAFCAMLASRFGEYATSESAGTVVGRGVEIGKGKGFGSRGKGRGLKTRGARALGEDFHDFCRCRIVTVTEKNYTELQAGAEKYYDSYRESADKVNDGLTLKVTDVSSEERLKNKYEWVNAEGSARNSKERTADILTAMRLYLGVK